MSDLVQRLRRLYVDQGTNYVQEAADRIEADEALLRRVYEAFSDEQRWRVVVGDDLGDRCGEAIAALRERLGEKE